MSSLLGGTAWVGAYGRWCFRFCCLGDMMDWRRQMGGIEMNETGAGCWPWAGRWGKMGDSQQGVGRQKGCYGANDVSLSVRLLPALASGTRPGAACVPGIPGMDRSRHALCKVTSSPASLLSSHSFADRAGTHARRRVDGRRRVPMYLARCSGGYATACTPYRLADISRLARPEVLVRHVIRPRYTSIRRYLRRPGELRLEDARKARLRATPAVAQLWERAGRANATSGMKSLGPPSWPGSCLPRPGHGGLGLWPVVGEGCAGAPPRWRAMSLSIAGATGASVRCG